VLHYLLLRASQIIIRLTFCVTFDRLVLFIFFCEKNEKLKVTFKVYYMLNNITTKISNNYDFLNKSSRSNLGKKIQTNYKLKQMKYYLMPLLNVDKQT
jgi:hypothetical protein